MMKSAQERLEGNIRFLQRVSVLQKLPEPKDHVLAKISDLIRVVNIFYNHLGAKFNFERKLCDIFLCRNSSLLTQK